MIAAIGHAEPRQSQTKVQIPWLPLVEEVEMRSRIKKRAEKDALDLVRATFRTGFAVEPAGIANRLGIQVLKTSFDVEETLGALFMRPAADPEIVLNERHSFLRRRLTCALEMGYYVQMSATTNDYQRVDLYGGSQQRGGEASDAYAREFAACLLMPGEDVRMLADLRIDDLMMALRFRVPREAMQGRLTDLDLDDFDLEAA